jgi:hypothetical protein
MANKRGVLRSAAPFVVTIGLLPACGAADVHPNPPGPETMSHNPPMPETPPAGAETAKPAEPPPPAAP